MNVSSSDGILRFEFDEDLLHTIEDALGSMKNESRRVLKNAVNDTARDAKKNLAKKAQETYAVKQGRFTKAMKTQNATLSDPTATINVTGEQMELKDFKVSPATYKTGPDKPDILKAKVLLSSSLKGLIKSNNKAFLVKFRSGHVSVAQRYYKSRLPIKKLLSNSIPTMIGSKERVFGVLEQEIYNTLMGNIIKEIERVTK